MESSLRIVAITNCPAGIAHTYMVAEALEQKARSLGHTIKVEIQGSSGIENRLSRRDCRCRLRDSRYRAWPER
ncbi:PTS system fructose-like transporter subunit IIB 1 [Klebsiella pneumoniae]|nr:PTS system fructose-like transporter subunit IIB 1 [Klebsiella pneumoniae]